MECNWEECKLKHLDGKLSCFIIFHKLLWEDALLANEYKTEDQITFFFSSLGVSVFEVKGSLSK